MEKSDSKKYQDARAPLGVINAHQFEYCVCELVVTY